MNGSAFFSAVTDRLIASPLAAGVARSISRRTLSRLALITAIPLCVFLIHASLLGSWIMDDAGISFAYARNLAAGHGLVSQPGAPPVEGYSDFLWVLLMAVFFRLGLFHAVWTPKIVAGVLTAGTFLVVTHTLRRSTSWWPGIAASALTLLALQPGLVIWSMSGLENSLYVFLLSLLLAGAAHLLATPAPSHTNMALLGVVAMGAAATRPDGVIYMAVVPMVLAARAWMARGLRPWLDALAVYGVVTAALLGVLTGFRWWYFGDVLPNTYYMKGAEHMTSIGAVVGLSPETVLRITNLAAAIAGHRAAVWFLLAVLAATVYLVGVRRFSPFLALLGLFSGVAAAAYLLLPRDFMGEYRFASPFFLFFYMYLVVLVWSLGDVTKVAPASRRALFAAVMALLVAVSLLHVARRSVSFAERPATPLAKVSDYFGDRYNLLAEGLGLQSASLLGPNQGGTLLHSNLKVFDLGGLCDPTIARTIGRDQRAFYDYVFERIRPTFIHLHGAWVKQANLDGDPRFRRDYVPIHVRHGYKKEAPYVESADFVRRDALRGPIDPRVAAILGDGF